MRESRMACRIPPMNAGSDRWTIDGAPAGRRDALSGPLVSVIVGVYNKERFVGECLRSVLAQTYTNWELIVVDDASTDNSLAEAERAIAGNSRAQILRRKTNSGMCGVARNDGMRVAQGEIFMFLDADDMWIPRKMEVQVAFMERHPDYLFCHARCWKVDADGQVLQVRHEAGLPGSGNYRIPLLERMWVSISTVACWRKLGAKVGGFTEDPLWAGEEDTEYALRCAKETDFGTIQEPLALYRVAEGNWSSKKWKGVGRDYLVYTHVYGRPDLWQGVKSRREMKRMLADIAVEGSQYWRGRRDFAKAWWFARQAVRRRPFSVEAWCQMAGCIVGRR